MRYWFSFILFLFILSSSKRGYSQTWELGLSAGGMGYMGDLNQHQFYDFTDLGIGASVKRNFDSYWSLKLGVLMGKVGASDHQSKYLEQRERNLSFFSPITELGIHTEFNFFDFGIE